MARQPSIARRLGPALLGLVKARREGGATIAEIRAELLERGVAIPMSSLQRVTVRIDAAAPEKRSGLLLAELRGIRRAAEAIAQHLTGRDRPERTIERLQKTE
jgi:hypothetical protein